MNLAERLKWARESRGYTQKEMAKDASVTLQTWQVYEAGKSVPGGNVLEALARMGFNVNWLLTGVGPRKLYEDEMKKLKCEEAHERLKKRVNDLLRSRPVVYYDIRGFPFEQVEAYAKGEYQPSKSELIALCKKSGAPYFDEEFIDEVTSVGLLDTTKPQPGSIGEDLLKAAIEAVEEYLQEVKGTLPPDKKAELILLICKLHAGKSKVEKATVISLVKLAV
ncbi:MAG TPA: helix-turn-helix transcriptional regulator [Geobacteraceae bacterium]